VDGAAKRGYTGAVQQKSNAQAGEKSVWRFPIDVGDLKMADNAPAGTKRRSKLRRITTGLAAGAARALRGLGGVGGTIALLIVFGACTVGVWWTAEDVIKGFVYGFIGPILYWEEILDVLTGKADTLAALTGAFVGFFLFLFRAMVLFGSLGIGAVSLGGIGAIWRRK